MYAKGKGSTVPSDAQAREKLALYVYEYLLHVGAQKAAQTFLSEIRWEKNITLGEPPGFLHSWWCVFWDLYCAAPERRDTCEHSSEAKAFHDYGFVNSGYAVNGIAAHCPQQAGSCSCLNPSAPSPLGQMPPNEGMPGGPMPPGGFFPQNSHMRPSPPQQPANQPSPHPQPPPPHTQMMQNQPFMSPRYPGGPRPGVRMPQQVEFNPPGGVPGQPMMPNSIDPTRQGDGGEFAGWQGPPSMNPMNPRMNPPRGQPLGPMNPGNYGGMRPPPNSTMGPGGPNMPPMSMPGPGGRPWQPNASSMNYSSASPGSHYGGPPVSASGPPGPGTPIMPSPQDSSNSGGDGMYAMMKPVPGGGMPGQFQMGPGGPEGPMGSMGPDMGPPVMNGMSSGGDGLDGMKNSPANGPGTPREDGPPMGDYGIPGYGQENGGYGLYLVADCAPENAECGCLMEESDCAHGSDARAVLGKPDWPIDETCADIATVKCFTSGLIVRFRRAADAERCCDQTESAAILKIKESMQEEAKRFEKDTPAEPPDYFMQ
ncbi:single-stranded DNA-binding protein 3-like isoform X7 [Dermacentor variabilis]|uniref:single-stranded DNA-binding protein 3-like isoform X7 n=1 Tax=Dermacentor variabilis TaxID=34621 RepID=UPI003F5C0C3F